MAKKRNTSQEEIVITEEEGRPFTVIMFGENTPIKGVAKQVLEELKHTEAQAISLATLFKEKHYLSPQEIGKALFREKIGSLHFVTLAAFLSGYLAGETYNSRFDRAVFGQSLGVGDEKTPVIGAALGGLIAHLNETNSVALPDRRISEKKAIKNPKKKPAMMRKKK